MVDALSTASAGILASAQRFNKSAQDVMQATFPDTTGTAPDLATAIVGTKTSDLAFQANTAVFEAADKMFGTLLDMIV